MLYSRSILFYFFHKTRYSLNNKFFLCIFNLCVFIFHKVCHLVERIINFYELLIYIFYASLPKITVVQFKLILTDKKILGK